MPLAHFETVLRLVPAYDFHMPSAAWIARYLLSSMDILDGCYTRDLTADALFHMLGDLLRELPPEAKPCLLQTAAEALLPQQEFQKLEKKYLRHKREPAPLMAHTALLLLPARRRQRTQIPCSQAARELLSADSHRRMQIGFSPVQKGQQYFTWQKDRYFYAGSFI